MSQTAHEISAHAHHEPDDDFNRGGERRTLAVVALSGMMMIGELIAGWLTGSVALKADGWHMGTHVGALGLTLAAYWYARTRANRGEFTFGTGKVYALAGFTSAVVLAIVALMLFVESIEHLVSSEVPRYAEAIPIAILGLVVNGVSALLLGGNHHFGHSHAGHSHSGHSHSGHSHAGHSHAGHDHDQTHAATTAEDASAEGAALDFNLRAAFIHILADALTSLFAIAALILGRYAGLRFLDPLTGILGGCVILWWATTLCRSAARQLLDVRSEPSQEAAVRACLEAIDDVRIADLHVWDLGPGRRSCVVSVVTSQPRDVEHYRKAVLAALPVSHLTIEVHGCALPHAADHAHDHDHDHDHDHAHDHRDRSG